MTVIKGMRAAAKYAGVSHQTIKNWKDLYGIGGTKDHYYCFTPEELAPFIEMHKLDLLARQARQALKK